MPQQHAVRTDIGGGTELGDQLHRMLGDQLVGREAGEDDQVDLAFEECGGTCPGAAHEGDGERCAGRFEGAAQPGRQTLVPT